MEDIIERSFKLNIVLLRVFGLYPSVSASASSVLLTKVRGFLLYLILLVLVTVLTLIGVFIKENFEFTQLNSVGLFLVETVNYCFKYLPLLINGKRIKKCVEYFGGRRFAPREEKEKEIIEECVRICQRTSMVYFIGIAVATVMWTIPSLIAKDYILPFEPWLPYNPTSKPSMFYGTLIFLTAVIFYDGMAGGMIDPLIGGLAYHATTQLKILKYNLQKLDKNLTAEDPENYRVITFQVAHSHLRRCIDHHNDILDFVNEYETCFSWCMLSQFAGSMFGMCFCCLGLLIVPAASAEGVKFVICFFLLSFQIFFYCYYGTLLFEENNGLITAIYEGPWYTCDVKVRKVLIVMMERSKKPMILTAGKVVNLTLDTFTAVLKTSYSMIAVLNNYQ